MLHPVILCGGAGERLWPASRPHRPKPFLTLVGGETTFQSALRRAAALPGAEPVTIIAGRPHERQVREALTRRDALMILEPVGRDTAAAMTAAALVIGARDPEAVLVFLPSDHFVPDTAAFTRHAAAMADQARAGWIALLGLRPDCPSPAYGYLLPEPGAPSPRRVARFIEKPDADRAAQLIADGCLWNAGVFAARADILLQELTRHAPDVVAVVQEAVRRRSQVASVILLDRVFEDAPALSFDIAVLERTDRAVVEAGDLVWSDLGAWDAILAASDRDRDGNSTRGHVVLQAASNCLVRAADGITVAVVGARNLAVIVDQDAVMVCDLESGHQVRAAIDRVSAGGR